MRHLTALVFSCLAVITLAAGNPDLGNPDRPASPERSAERHRAGLEAKARALALEAEAHALPPGRAREAGLDAARGEFEAAASAQSLALEAHAHNIDAANELGYALRKLGRTEEAIGVYNYALGIDAEFYPAIEYRAEAHLALGQLPDVRAAYLSLFRHAPALAATLLDAADRWLASAPQSEEVRQFAAWVAERRRLAAVTPTTSSNVTW